MKIVLKIIISILILHSSQSFSESVASFPPDLDEWVLVKESIMPGKNVELPKETSLFLQRTVATYNWINDGEGTKLNIYVPKEKLQAYQQHGPYKDGATAVGIYEDSDIIFVTEHFAGEVIYGTYNREGEDISDTHPTFNVNLCIQCHTENSDICINGTCATPIVDVFKK